LIEKYTLGGTDGVVVGNQDGADILRDRGYSGPIKVMPQLGVDDKLFSPQEQPALREKLGIQPDEFVIGFVGRYVEEKGLLTLAKAVTQLGDRPWKWVLLGRGPLKEAVIKTAEEAGVGDRLIWVESVPHDDVPRYINLMDTLVLPSETTYRFKTLTAVGWKEQFGHVIIEAMACRVPVIGSDSGEIPYVIGDAGLVFPEGDATALADCLTKLIDQPEVKHQVAQKGYDRAMAQYTNHALAQQQLAFYQSLVGT
ncbi:MAG: glycosyltransferase, partial [Cyanobacteria bacterium P01_C01_bin.73]